MQLNDSQSLSRFLDFINTQLDLSVLGEDESVPRLSELEIEQQVMPLIRDDMTRETLRIVGQLLRNPQHDHWRAQLAPLHREVRACLARTVGGVMEQRYPERLSDEEWVDVTTFAITVAWLVRKQMDSDEPPALEN
jgi:hypothetical protein